MRFICRFPFPMMLFVSVGCMAFGNAKSFSVSPSGTQQFTAAGHEQNKQNNVPEDSCSWFEERAKLSPPNFLPALIAAMIEVALDFVGIVVGRGFAFAQLHSEHRNDHYDLDQGRLAPHPPRGTPERRRVSRASQMSGFCPAGAFGATVIAAQKHFSSPRRQLICVLCHARPTRPRAAFFQQLLIVCLMVADLLSCKTRRLHSS